MWTVLEEVSLAGSELPGTHGTLIEDLAGRCGALAWILDGASPVSDTRVVVDAPSDAYWLVKQLDDGLRLAASDPGQDSRPLSDIVASAIRHAAAAAEHDFVTTPDVPPSAALGVIRRRAGTTEFLVLADVSVLLSTDAGVVAYSDQRVDRDNVEARKTMRECLQQDMTMEQALEQALEQLRERRVHAMNRPGGYWVASLDEEAAHHGLTGTLDGVNQAILATDGFMRIVEPFHQRTVEQLFDGTTPDFEMLARNLRHAEKEDLMGRHFRWRVSDDLCAQRVEWDA